MEILTFNPQGVCSRTVRIAHENGVIISCEVIGGCHGNLQGISSLLKGMKIEDVIARLEGIKCGYKQTSCPDQIAKGLKTLLK
jgi:uncharacterized protein (TIGR03905 family)